MFYVGKLVGFVLLCLLTLGQGRAIGVSALASGPGSEFIISELRVDLPAIYSANNYYLDLKSTTPSWAGAGGSHTNVWLSVNLAPGTLDGSGQLVTYSQKFSQIGLLRDSAGLHWFVYAEPGVTCLRGQVHWSRPNIGAIGCLGAANDLITDGVWYTVQIVRVATGPTSGYWETRLQSGGSWNTVARINDPSSRIYRANAAMEQSMVSGANPNLPAQYYLRNPRYGANGWVTSSGSAYSYIFETDTDRLATNDHCPNRYAARPLLDGSDRAWYAGTGGTTCQWLLFPQNSTYSAEGRHTSRIAAINMSGSTSRLNVAWLDSFGTPLCTQYVSSLGSYRSFGASSCSGAASVIAQSDYSLGGSVQSTMSGGIQSNVSLVRTLSSTGSYVPLAIRRAGSAQSTTEFLIFNPNPSFVTASVYLRGSAGAGEYTKSNISISPLGTFSYSLYDESNLSIGWAGSAFVSAGSQPIVVVANQNSAGTRQSLNGIPVSAANTTWHIPLFASRLANGLNTPISVQNVSGGNIGPNGISMSCVKDPGSSGNPTFNTSNVSTTITNYESFFFNPVINMSYPDNWYGACTVTSTASTVAFVQNRFVNAGPLNNAAAYEALPANSSYTTLVFPFVAKRLPDGTATAVVIQNMSGSPATVTLSYRYANLASGCQDTGVSNPAAYTIPVGASYIRNHRLYTAPGGTPSAAEEVGMPNNWCGSLLVTSNQPIDGYFQVTNINNTANDSFSTSVASK